MVNAKIHSLPRPIKWFSVPRLCRAENPQKGRLREFFQWNVDVIGADSILADAECVFVAADLLRELGLGSQDVCVRIGSRPLTLAALAAAGVDAARTEQALVILDKRPKLSEDEFRAFAAEGGMTAGQIESIERFQACPDVAALREHFAGDASVAGHLDELGELMGALRSFGVADYCVLDMRIVRGLAYYTGVVYEVFDRGASLRAGAGGGRYDNLLSVLGGPKVGGTGFGMGDVVLGILLDEKGRLPASAQRLEFFVLDDPPDQLDRVLAVAGVLRAKGLSADFSYKRQNVGKQLKEANRRGAERAVIVRGETVAVKNLATGQQVERTMAEFLDRPAGGTIESCNT